MLDQIIRWDDKYFGTKLHIHAPAHLHKEPDFNILAIEGNFSANEWKVNLGPDLRMIVPSLWPVTTAYAFHPSGPFTAPSGEKTFTNNEIVAFVQETCRQQERTIASFENRARICGWVEPNLPGSTAVPTLNPRNNCG
ncbi:MAG: hypothetical protein WCD70_08315 [Alphaproteobacteria bacterium]